MKVILLNGPARSGKDYIYSLVRKHFGPNHIRCKFANHLKQLAHELLANGEPPDHFESIKDIPQAYLQSRTWREVYITLSEKFLKPFAGQEYFGKQLVSTLESLPDGSTAWVTDSGFSREALPVVEFAGRENVLHVWVMRPGSTFSGDSRGYWNLDCITTRTIHNDGDDDRLLDQLVQIVRWTDDANIYSEAMR